MKIEIQHKAREMRQQGMSVKAIATALHVSTSSVSLWVRNIELTNTQKQTLREHQRLWGASNSGAQINRNKARQKRIAYQEDGRAKARENRPLHLAGCMLYWAEGAKARNGVYFVNSDPNMILTFARFLREELGVVNSEFAIRVHCHTVVASEIKAIESYWINILGLSFACLRKTHIKQGSETRKSKLEYGICDLRIHRTDLVQHIFGAIQEYGGFENPDWLF
jgi:hypothetical protein